MDRDGSAGVAQAAETVARAQDRGRCWCDGQRSARERDRGVVGRGKLPKACKLGRGEHALAWRGQRVALSTLDASGVQAAPAAAQAGAPLDQTILGAAGTQLGGDSLAYGPVRADDSNVGEEQGAMLDVQASDQLLVLNLGGVERRDAQLACTGEMTLVALVGALGVALEQSRCGCQGQLH